MFRGVTFLPTNLKIKVLINEMIFKFLLDTNRNSNNLGIFIVYLLILFPVNGKKYFVFINDNNI